MLIAVGSLLRTVRTIADRLAAIQSCLARCLVAGRQLAAAPMSFDYDSFEFAELPVALPLDEEQRLQNEIEHKINAGACDIAFVSDG